MQSSNQMRFAMAIHMLQKSNPAARQDLHGKRETTRRHLGRAAERSTERQSASGTHSR